MILAMFRVFKGLFFTIAMYIHILVFQNTQNLEYKIFVLKIKF